jgi:hypothetical protein
MFERRICIVILVGFSQINKIKTTHCNDTYIENIPECEEVRYSVNSNLECFFNDVVNDEEDEHHLAGHQRVVAGAGVLEQLDG